MVNPADDSQPLIIHESWGQKFCFGSTPTAPALISEIFSDNYKILEKAIEFGPGDVILDLGACEGMFSIMLSRLFPLTRIIALEPVSKTYSQMLHNIELNGCSNILAHNIGVGKKEQQKAILNISKEFSGGSTAFCTFVPLDHYQEEVNIISLDSVFDLYHIKRLRLLKIDIEGGEYDALYSSTILSRIDYMTAEFHMNRKLEFESRRADGLRTWVSNQTNLIHCDIIRMAE